LFAVGIILHEMLTGERLFWKDDLQTTIYRVLDRPIPKPSLKVPVAPDLEAVVMRLLERDLASRYATAEKAGEALAGCVDASLRSRGELAHLLAERFPQAASSRASRPPPSPGGRAESSASEPPPSDQDHVSSSRSRTRSLGPASQATSVSLAASESMQPSLPAPRRRRLLTGVAIMVIVSGVAGVFAGTRGRHERSAVEAATVAPPPEPRATVATVPTLPTNASGVTAPPDAAVSDAAGRDATVRDVLPIPDAAPPVVVGPAASSSTVPVARPPAATPAKVTKPKEVPARRPGNASSDDVGGD